MGFAKLTVKHILLLLNFICMVLGLVFIGFGAFILVSSAQNRVDNGEKVAGGLIITLGIVVIILAMFGTLAAVHEARNKMMVYIICLIVMLLVQLSMNGMAAQGTKDGLSGSVKAGFEKLWEYEEESPGSLAYYEDWLECCGVNGADDYAYINHTITKTCCKEHDCSRRNNIWADGCRMKFEDYLAHKMLTFVIVGWVLIFAEAAGILFGWLLFRGLKNKNRLDGAVGCKQNENECVYLH